MFTKVHLRIRSGNFYVYLWVMFYVEFVRGLEHYKRFMNYLFCVYVLGKIKH